MTIRGCLLFTRYRLDIKRLGICHRSIGGRGGNGGTGGIHMAENTLAFASQAGRIPTGSGLSVKEAISVLSALLHPTRLEIFRYLVTREPNGIVPGAIAGIVGAPQHTISTHLAILVRAGLLRSQRKRQTVIYRANVERIISLFGFLVEDCCDGHPALCERLRATLDEGYDQFPKRSG
jgi:ArsR family transcriptional regulator, arsenate/arsenite/antimonite-responsive transcriptional repressor